MTGRRFPDGHGRTAYRHEERARTARENAMARDARTPAEQLRTLDARLGVNVGAAKERARLRRQIAGAR